MKLFIDGTEEIKKKDRFPLVRWAGNCIAVADLRRKMEMDKKPRRVQNLLPIVPYLTDKEWWVLWTIGGHWAGLGRGRGKAWIPEDIYQSDSSGGPVLKDLLIWRPSDIYLEGLLRRMKFGRVLEEEKTLLQKLNDLEEGVYEQKETVREEHP